LTALFGGLGAFVFSNFQTCLKDADEKITRFQHLTDEIAMRRVDIVQAIGTSLTRAELQTKMKDVHSTRDELKGQSLSSLVSERVDIISAMLNEYQPGFSNRQYFDDAQVLRAILANPKIPLTKKRSYYMLLTRGELNFDIDEADLPVLHQDVLPQIWNVEND
jgi:hypothetical protein